jgi:copper resistance protein D
MESTLPQTVSTALINFSLAWVVGVLASRFWLRNGTEDWQSTAIERLASAMTFALMAGIVGILLSLWTESAAMGDVPWLDAWPACKEMLTSTHYGHAGVAAAVLLTIALMVHWRFGRQAKEARYLVSMMVLVLLILGARVTIGHAFEHGLWSPAAWIEWLHLILMSLWAGIVFVAGWMVLPQTLAHESAPPTARGRYLASMSNWASAALVGILATGAYNSYRVLGSVRELVNTDYGHVLVFKLVFVLLAIALGGYNKVIGLPLGLAPDEEPAKSRRGLRRVIAVLRVESVALFLVLAAAAVMTNSAPPGQ